MDLSRYQHTETISIAAPPDVVYEMVSDVTRMGEWSPVCTTCEWDDDDHVWFTGTNTIPERTWQTKCRVDVAEPGREFAFVNCGLDGTMELVRWGYSLAPTGDGGTEVTEAWSVLPGYDEFLAKLAPNLDVVDYLEATLPPTRAGMVETLARLKAAAEG